MKPFYLRVLLLVFMVWPSAAQAEAAEPEDRWRDAFQFLHLELKKEGLTDEQLKPFDLQKMRYLDNVVESKMLNIVWVPGDYTQFYDRRGVRETAKFIRQHSTTFHRVETETSVAQSVIASIMWVETAYGKYKGKYSVLDTVASISALQVPSFGHGVAERIEKVAEKRKLDGRERVDWKARSKKLGKRWFKELKAFLILAHELKWKPHEVKGSWAGAFGLGQFMPLTALETITRSKKIIQTDFWSWDDTIKMIARYLHRMGWKKGASWARKKRSIYRYNNSDDYVNAVLKLSALAEIELKKKR